MTTCTRIVFRCFRSLERFGDRMTGAAGPVFVTLAVVLLGTGTVCFFDIIQPTLPILSIPVNVLIAINLWFHYAFACTVKPGFIGDPPQVNGHSWMWTKPVRKQTHMFPQNGTSTGVRWSTTLNMTEAQLTRCRKCGLTRPERAHHCRVCDRCVLKYDHHCPVRQFPFPDQVRRYNVNCYKWINQCVGIYNERHFVLFMVYLVIATFCFSALGYNKMLDAMGFTYSLWPYLVPSPVYSLIYILAVVLCLAVFIMLSWHLWSISAAETSVESHDHDVYRRAAKKRNETFENSYDLGRVRNLQLFFNVWENGYPWYTLIVPFRILPYTDGRSWARRDGYYSHRGIQPGEELTDEEEETDEE